VASVCRQAGRDGVPGDVEHGAAELPVVQDRATPEARLEDVAAAAVTQVEALRVPAEQALHPA